MNNIEVVNLLKEGFKDLGEKLKTQGQTLSSHGESLKKISDQQDQLGEEVKLVKDDLTNQKANVDQNTLQIHKTQEGLSDLQEQINGLASNQQDLRRREGRR